MKCDHFITPAKRLFAFSGAGIKCDKCGCPVRSFHVISTSIASGLSVFYFMPIVLALFLIGQYWWVVAIVILAVLLVVYVYETLAGPLLAVEKRGVASE